MKRTDIIQSLIDKVGAENYLEVGVSAGENFRDIKCKNKVGVDPEPSTPATIHIDSDSFFKDNKRTFDVIFIDGLHHADQVYSCLLYTSPSPRDTLLSRMPSSA